MKPSALFNNAYTVIDDLGSDDYGGLYRVVDNVTGQRYLAQFFDPDSPLQRLIALLDVPSTNYELANFFALQNPFVAFIRRFERDSGDLNYVLMDDRPGVRLQTFQLLYDPSVLNTFILQMCDALNYLHLKGMRHLDLRPETILIDTSSDQISFYLLGGGLAYFLNSPAEPVGHLVGHRISSLRYQSPEALAGRPVDSRSDLYALGLILYEAITRHHPFAASDARQIFAMQGTKKLPPCRPVGDLKSSSLCRMVDRLLTADMVARPQSAGEVMASVFEGMPEPFPPPPLVLCPITDHALSRTEILSAFTDTLSGRASIVALMGESGVGKTHLLRELAAEFYGADTQQLTFRSIPGTDTEHGYGILSALISRLHAMFPELPPNLIDILYHLEFDDNHLYLFDNSYLDSIIHQTALEMFIALSSEDPQRTTKPMVVILENCHFTDHIFWKFWVKLTELAAVSPRYWPWLWIIETNSQTVYPTALAAPRFHSVEALSFDKYQATTMLKMLAGVDTAPETLTARMYDLSKGVAADIRLLSNMMHYTNGIFYDDHQWRFDTDSLQYMFQHDNLNVLIDAFVANHLSRAESGALTFLSLWPDGCPVDQLKNYLQTSETKSFEVSGFGMVLAAGWVERDLRHGTPTYVFSNERFRARIHSNIPAYQRQEYHLELANQLLSQEPVQPAAVSKQFFMADNRLHGCDWALTAARHYRKTGAFDPAIQWFWRKLENLPERNRTKIAGANFELSQVLLLTQDFKKALIALIDAEAILGSRFYQKRDHAHYFLLTSICRFMLNDKDTAIKDLDRSLHYLPKTTAFDYRLKIMAFFSRAIQTPEQEQSLLNLFNDYQKQLPFSQYPHFSGVLLEWAANCYFEQHLSSSGEYFLKQSISCAEKSHDIHAVIQRRLLMGMHFKKANKYKLAISEFEIAVLLSRKTYSLKTLCHGLCHIASLLMEQHTYKDAEKLLIEACEIAAKGDDPLLKIRSSVLYSHFLIQSGRIDQAERLLIEAEGLLDDRSPVMLHHPLYIGLANVARRQGNFVRVLELYTRFLERVRSQDDPMFTMFAYLYMASANCRLADYKQVMILLVEAENLAEKLKMTLPDTNIIRAWVHFLQGRIGSAQKLVQKGLTLAKRSNLIPHQASAYNLLGLINLEQHNFDAAMVDFKRSLNLFIANHDEFEAALVHRLIAETYYAMDKLDAAERENKTADDLYKKLGANFYLIDRTLPGTHGSTSPFRTSRCFPEPADISSLIQSLVHPDQFHNRLLQVFLTPKIFARGLVLQVLYPTDKITVLAGDTEFTSDETQKILSRYASEISNKKMLLIQSYPLQETDDDQSSKPALRSWLARFSTGSDEQILLYLEDNPQLMDESSAYLHSIFPIAGAAMTISRRFQKTADIPSVFEATDPSRAIVARSREMTKIVKAIKTIAYSTLPALITGAEGTGKSFIVRYIHHLSAYHAAPLVVIACDTLNQAEQAGVLIETILSNLQVGDTTAKKIVVLEHVETLNKVQQADLLELLTKTIRAAGYPLSETRFLFTSSESLIEYVQQELFDLSLYKSISNLTIRLPDLVDRKEDIPHLAVKFLQNSSVLMKKPFTDFSSETLEVLINYTWPGNVSELETAIESAVLFGVPPTIMFDDLPKSVRAPVERSGILDRERLVLESIEAIEEAHIRSVLQTTRGNKFRASELLGISRPTLDRKLEKFGIRVDKKRKR